MTSRRRAPFPAPPDLAPELDPAPGLLASGARWDGVEASERTGAPDELVGVQLREVVWTGAQLVGRRFRGLDCRDVRFVGADLAGTSFEGGRFVRVVFEGCRMAGAILSGAHLEDVLVVDSRMDLAVARMADVRRSAFEGSDLTEADLYGSRLTDVRFADCTLDAACVEAVVSEGIELGGSRVDRMRGVTALAGARISPDQVTPLGTALLGELRFQLS